MTKIVDTPDFKSEQEEADWWFTHQHVIEEMFEEEFGPVPEGFVGVDLSGDDACLLRKQAESRGVDPQAYAVELLRTALQQCEKPFHDKAA